LVPKSVTFNDLERRNGRYFVIYFNEIGSFWGAHCVKVVENIPKVDPTKM